MPDLTVQLRQYAEYAMDAVSPVGAEEIAGGQGTLRPSPRRKGRPRRTMALMIASAAAVALAVIGLTDGEAPDDVGIATRPDPSVAPAPRSPTTPAAEPGGPEAGSFAATVRASGIPGARRTVPGGVSIRAGTISGQSFWVTVPDDLPGVDAVLVVPDATVRIQSPTTPRTYLTAMSAAEVAAGSCGDVPVCGAPRIQDERALPSGATFTRWGTGITAESTATIAMGPWTLVLEGPDVTAAEAIAASVTWLVDPDGYLVLRSADPAVQVTESGVTLVAANSGSPADGVRIHVSPGCHGDRTTNPPALGPALERFGTSRVSSAAPVPERPAYGGRWCAAEGYGVEVVTGDERVLERLHATLRVSAK